MANFQQILQDEIRRLARKEMKPAMEALQARVIEQRKTIAELTKRVKALETQGTAAAQPAVAVPAADAKESAHAVRLSAPGIVRIRTKLKLNQCQFAALLGVSPLSVRQWEAGETTPRAAQKAKIAACRHLGKRELLRRLAGTGITPGKRTQRTAKVATPQVPAAPAPEKKA